MLADTAAIRSPLQIVAPGAVILCFVIGAFLLWKRTGRAPALMQLVAASLLFLDWAITGIYEFASKSNAWEGERFWPERFQPVRIIILVTAVVVFPIAYLWYAFTQKTSNQAIERTADRPRKL